MHDFSMHRGETFHKYLRIKKNGGPVDLSGYAARCQVRESPDGGQLLCDVGCIFPGTAGHLELMIPAEVSASFPPGVYVWDLRVTSDRQEVRFYVGGKFRVLPSVTE